METKAKIVNTSSELTSEEQNTLGTEAGTPTKLPQSEEHFWIDHRYKVTKFLGEGAFGAVFLVYDELNRDYFALKMLKNKQHTNIFQREIQIMQDLSNSNEMAGKSITHLFEYNINNGVIISSNNEVLANDVSYFVTDYYSRLRTDNPCSGFEIKCAPQGDLASNIIKNVETYRQGLSESDIFTIFHQLLEAVEAIHKQGFVHLDIKPDNILLYDNFQVSLSDFALAKEIAGEDGRGNFNSYKAGTRQYWSPEMFLNLPYNGVQSDLYALGVTLFIITFACCPFSEATMDDPLFSKMVQKPVEFWKHHPETSRKLAENSVSPDLIKLLNYMLCPFPQYRLSVEQIKQQKWYVDNTKSVCLEHFDQNLWNDSVVQSDPGSESDLSSSPEIDEESGEEDIES